MNALSRPRRALAAVLLPTTLLLAACGGSDSSDDAAPRSSDSPDTSQEAAADEPSAAEDEAVTRRTYQALALDEEVQPNERTWAMTANLVGGWATSPVTDGDVLATYDLDGHLVGMADDDDEDEPQGEACGRVLTGGDDPVVLSLVEEWQEAEGVQAGGFDFKVTKSSADFSTTETVSMGFSEQQLTDGLNGYGFTCPFQTTTDGRYLLMARGLTWLLVDVETMEARELDDIPAGYALVGDVLLETSEEKGISVLDPDDLSVLRTERDDSTSEGSRLQDLVEEFLGAGLLNDSNSYRILAGGSNEVIFWRNEDEGRVLVTYDVVSGKETRASEPLTVKAFYGPQLHIDWTGHDFFVLDPDGQLVVLDRDLKVVTTMDAAKARISSVCGSHDGQVAVIASNQLAILDQDTMEQVTYSPDYSSCGSVSTKRFGWYKGLDAGVLSYFDQELVSMAPAETD